MLLQLGYGSNSTWLLRVLELFVGGSGRQGRVLDIRGWDSESGRSVANIVWDTGSTNVYRLGHKGKIDLKYIQDASGGYYYREHLLKLGKAGFTVLFYGKPAELRVMGLLLSRHDNYQKQN